MANIPAFFVVAAAALVAVIGFPLVGHYCCGANRCDDCYFASLIRVAEVVYLVVNSTLLYGVCMDTPHVQDDCNLICVLVMFLIIAEVASCCSSWSE